MARVLADLEKDISALSRADKEKLLDFLIEDVDAPPEDLRELAHELNTAVDRTSRSLERTLAYLEGFGDRLERQRIEVRRAVIESGERWPFRARLSRD